ncbi:MAG: hypothetical protein JRS35_12820 [Deltaproteobacteria bacterium]|nr:hypothetical protein [Deltaproteobacteria bacterium]
MRVELEGEPLAEDGQGTELALEIKASRRVHAGDLRGLRVLAEESEPRRRLVVCLEDEPRMTPDKVEILPWRSFFERLWKGELGV